ncbi:unnamed protein product [Choristocarpus tenellus]
MALFTVRLPDTVSTISEEAQAGTVKVASISCWSKATTIEVEPAGRAYWEYLQRCRAIDSKKIGNVSAIRVAADEEEEEEEGDIEFSLRDDLTPELVSELTHYEVLGFEKYGNGVRDEGLKKAYRKAVLKYHPDKTGSQEGEEDEVFMAVQKAFETLTDTTKRRAYDSSLEFDDYIPDDQEGKDETGPRSFYNVYGPVFERNKRFAVILPAPSLGNADTPLDEVNIFYEYWVNFESWRDFSLEGEHDLEDAQDRYEKRWMMKENERKAKELKRKEYRRLSTLVDRARAADPRVIRAREEEKAAKKNAKLAKAREKQEREDSIRKAVEDEKRKKEDEETRIRQEARAAKAEREKAKKELRRQRKIMKHLYGVAVARVTVDGNNGGGGEGKCGVTPVGEEELEWLMVNLDLDGVNCAIEGLGSKEEAIKVEGLDVLKGLMERRKGEIAEEEAQAEEAVKKDMEALLAAESKAVANREARKRPWEEAEMSSLAKAIVKFPAGSQNRWEHIASFIAQATKAKNPRTKEECISRYQEVHAAPAGSATKAVAPPPSLAAQAAAGLATQARNKETKITPARRERTEPREDVWSQDQQKQLEAALARFPMGMDKNERWASISAAVPGKTKKQCVERFKLVKTQLLAKKKAAKAAEKAAAEAEAAKAASVTTAEVVASGK